MYTIFSIYLPALLTSLNVGIYFICCMWICRGICTEVRNSVRIRKSASSLFCWAECTWSRHELFVSEIPALTEEQQIPPETMCSNLQADVFTLCLHEYVKVHCYSEAELYLYGLCETKFTPCKYLYVSKECYSFILSKWDVDGLCKAFFGEHNSLV